MGFAEKVCENPEQVSIRRTTLPLKITTMMKTPLKPQMPIKHTTIRLTLEVTREKKLWTMMMMMMRKTTVSLYVALNDVTVLGAPELDAMALLPDTWDKILNLK